ncbi:MAG: hypothetical protein H5T50_00950 [Nitrososphaeria archaeon]|nr:hypothetical protein [Nitrososphaeria archaeon]
MLLNLSVLKFIFFIAGLTCLILAGWLIGVVTFNEGVKQLGLRNSLYIKSLIIGALGLILIILSLLKEIVHIRHRLHSPYQ